jgi:hypothetical protein
MGAGKTLLHALRQSDGTVLHYITDMQKYNNNTHPYQALPVPQPPSAVRSGLRPSEPQPPDSHENGACYGGILYAA